jgi:peptidoglycan/LPS O-acetylase OafA/YrhL
MFKGIETDDWNYARTDKTLGDGLSLWLDFVRFSAALAVFLFHLSVPQNGGAWFRVGTLGTDAVIVFFVLSGLVITYVADQKERSVELYAASRLARLWSVLIPALTATYFIDLIGHWIDPAVYEGWGPWIASDGGIWRLFPSLFFVNELWFKSIPPLSNGPVWSLGFEFWYYVMFAAGCYFTGTARIILLVLAALIAGPRILLLFPIWLLGSSVYLIAQRWRAPEWMGWALFLAPPTVIAWMSATKHHIRLLEIGTSLFGEGDKWKSCQPFVWLYFLGTALALHFLGAYSVERRLLSMLHRFTWSIRFVSGLTLSIYLFHAPIMVAVSALLNKMSIGPLRTTITALATLVLCTTLGLICEPQRYPIRRLLLLLTAKSSAMPRRIPGH